MSHLLQRRHLVLANRHFPVSDLMEGLTDD